MRSPVRKDSLAVLSALGILTASFLFGIYGPGRKKAESLSTQIRAAEQSLREIPTRVEELESLNTEIASRKSYLERVNGFTHRDADLHAIIGEVARLAEAHQLRVKRLEPMQPVEHETYSIQPFHLNLEGLYPDLVAFLGKLENRRQLFIVESLSVSRPLRQAAATTSVEVHFSTFTSDTEFSDFDGIDASGNKRIADTR